MTDPAPRAPVNPKVIFATIAAILLPAFLAVLGYLQTDEGKTLFA